MAGSAGSQHVEETKREAHGEDPSTDDALKKPLLGNLNRGQDRNPTRMESQVEEEMRIVELPPYRRVSFTRSWFNATNALTGIGILSMPYALAQGGWLSLLLFFLTAILFCYTGHLIQRCMDVAPSITSYVDIAEVAFGYKGKLTVAVIMYFELYICGVSHLILEGDNLDNFFPNAHIQVLSLSIQGKQLFIIVAALVIMPTTWLKDLSVLAYFSAAGVLASFVLLGTLIWIAITDHSTGFVGARETRMLNLSSLPVAVGLYAICFCGHAVFPTIYASMKDPSRFSKVLQISFGLGTLTCGSAAVMGYLMYGSDVRSQVTLNLPRGRFCSKLAIFTTVVTPLTKYPWTITPIALAIEERLSASPSANPNILIRTLLLMGTVVIALVVPFFGYIMAFIGSFLGLSVSVLLPCLCYLKIFDKASGQSNMQRLKITSILLFGTVVSIMGTYSSVSRIIYSKLMS